MNACNPIKRILKDPEKTQAMADTIIKRGYCVNDTTMSVTIDTVIINSIIYATDTFELEDSCTIDTILPSGTRITIIDNQLIVKEKQKVVVKTITNTVNNYIRDRSLENLLTKDVALTRDSLAQARANVVILKDMNKYLNKKILRINIVLFFIGLVIAVITVIRIYFKLKTRI